MSERAWLFADTIPRVRTLDGLAEIEELALLWLTEHTERALILSQLSNRRAELMRRYEAPRAVPLRGRSAILSLLLLSGCAIGDVVRTEIGRSGPWTLYHTVEAMAGTHCEALHADSALVAGPGFLIYDVRQYGSLTSAAYGIGNDTTERPLPNVGGPLITIDDTLFRDAVASGLLRLHLTYSARTVHRIEVDLAALRPLLAPLATCALR